jgi:hypothetical protein
VIIEYAPWRLACRRCGAHSVELLGWADPYQRQSRRLQQNLALDAFSMPLLHVSTKWGLSWHTVRRAELDAVERWDRTVRRLLRMVGVDERARRRHKRKEKFVTIVSDLEMPIWTARARSETLKTWLDCSLSQKALIAVRGRMHEPFKKAVRDDPARTCGRRPRPVPHHQARRRGYRAQAVFFRGPGGELSEGTRGWCFAPGSAPPKNSVNSPDGSGSAELGRAYQLVEEPGRAASS